MYIAAKTSYIDMSSRFTAPHCLCYYQAINSRAGMNWLTLRVASVASYNLIPYIICPACCYFLRFVKWMQHISSFYLWKTLELAQTQTLELCVEEVIFPPTVTAVARCTNSLCFHKRSCGAQAAWPSFLPCSCSALGRWAALNNSWSVRIGIP